jgi:hypothetical protein
MLSARRLAICLLLFVGLQLFTGAARGAVIAEDSASAPAYASESDGAWKGLNPTPNENPPGMDNGGYGLLPWNFAGGFHQPDYSPYGRLNHFIDGVDFATTAYNNLGAPAFALTNSNAGCVIFGCAFGGETARATRSFAAPLAPGETVTFHFDNPLLLREIDWSPAGFLIRMNTGGGPVDPNDPNSTAKERFGMFANTGVYAFPGLFGNNWAIADGSGNNDTGVAVSATTSGAEFQFTLQTPESYAMAVKRLSDGAVLFSSTGSLSNAEAGAIDSLEIAIYGNGSGNGLTGASMQATGEREFYFNNLRIESAGNVIALPGDYNDDGSVDAADYVIWRSMLGQSVTPGSSADGDGSGEVNDLDYDVWRMHFGSSTPAAAALAVPEPSAMISGIVIFVAGMLVRCRRG